MGAAELQTLVSTAARSGAASGLSPKNSTATASVVRHEAVRCASNTATSVDTIADSMGWALPCTKATITRQEFQMLRRAAAAVSWTVQRSLSPLRILKFKKPADEHTHTQLMLESY